MIEQLYEGLMTAATDWRLPIERIDESVRRILALKTQNTPGQPPAMTWTRSQLQSTSASSPRSARQAHIAGTRKRYRKSLGS